MTIKNDTDDDTDDMINDNTIIPSEIENTGNNENEIEDQFPDEDKYENNIEESTIGHKEDTYEEQITIDDIIIFTEMNM